MSLEPKNDLVSISLKTKNFRKKVHVLYPVSCEIFGLFRQMETWKKMRFKCFKYNLNDKLSIRIDKRYEMYSLVQKCSIFYWCNYENSEKLRLVVLRSVSMLKFQNHVLLRSKLVFLGIHKLQSK